MKTSQIILFPNKISAQMASFLIEPWAGEIWTCS